MFPDYEFTTVSYRYSVYYPVVPDYLDLCE